jgi:renalase
MTGMAAQPDVAVIGAGLAGAACARALAQGGHRPVLFDKGRGPGGRLSTRRAETPLGEARMDHGAQYLTARSRSFQSFLSAAATSGQAAAWSARLVSVAADGAVSDLHAEERWVGVPGMSAIAKAALEGLDARFGLRAVRVSGTPRAWMIHFEDGAAQGPFVRVALTLPPEQLIEVLARSEGDFGGMVQEAGTAVMAPCWAVMGAIAAPFDPGFDGARLQDGAVRWIARTNSRPGQSGPDTWVLHASPDWSRAHLEETAEFVGGALWQAMHARIALPAARWLSAHRWRYAQSERAPGTPFALDVTGTIGCAGDWRLGARAECAWESGEALGKAMATSLRS